MKMSISCMICVGLIIVHLPALSVSVDAQVIVIESKTDNSGQEDSEQEDSETEESVEQFEKLDLRTLLTHEEFSVSREAFHMLRQLTESEGHEVRHAAIKAIDEFCSDGFEWLNENADISPPLVKSEITLRATYPSRYEEPALHSVAFVNRDIEMSKLVYLQLIDCESLAFVDMPKFTDARLNYLMGQNELLSLTLENTSVRGIGFRNVNLPKVKVIFFTGSKLNNYGIRLLKSGKLPQLEEIIANDTKVTEEQISSLRETDEWNIKIRFNNE